MIVKALRGRRQVVLAGLGFVSLGAPVGAYGVAWPSMRASFHQPISSLGLLLFALLPVRALRNSEHLVGLAHDDHGTGHSAGNP